MELISFREIASVKLFTVEVSEDELDVYERCMRHLEKVLQSDEVEQISGATQEEFKALYEDISMLLSEKIKHRKRNF